MGFEEHCSVMDRFVEALQCGPDGTISNDEPQIVQNMMDAHKQDPDRLTVSFTVVQHAGRLAGVNGDYAQLRRPAEAS
jgi:hypothetical protein